jgi:L-alanine-DL-glutamate epimerase-like enolase superfamily enzyme
MAISAVDVALWDLKAKLLGVCLADALPRYRETIPIYGSGGFCNYTDDQLREQVSEWSDAGFGSMKIKVGREKLRDPARVEIVREAGGPELEIMVDGNGGYEPEEALQWADCFSQQGVTVLRRAAQLAGSGWGGGRATPGSRGDGNRRRRVRLEPPVLPADARRGSGSHPAS